MQAPHSTNHRTWAALVGAAVAGAIAALLMLAAAPGGAEAGSDRDCSDFTSQAAAQSFFISAGGPGGDPHSLDGDGDGIACESNPCPCSTSTGGGTTSTTTTSTTTSTTTPSTTSTTTTPTTGPTVVRIVRVVDGDTVVVSIQASGQRPIEETVRVIGIDTPESVAPGTPVECGAKEASGEMSKLARPGDIVTLISDSSQDDRDVYGRLLRYVEQSSVDFGRELVRKGWAKPYVYETPFNRLGAYSKARKQAKEKERGVWGKCGGSFHAPD